MGVYIYVWDKHVIIDNHKTSYEKNEEVRLSHVHNFFMIEVY